jgi:uncharacterized surface protein with fasciclin (FAS1) repeats
MRPSNTAQIGTTRVLAASAIAGALALTATACGSSTSPAPAAAGASPSHHAMAHHAMAETARFGSDCGMVPATGMGSFHGMSMDPVVTAAAHNPLLSTLAADIKTSRLSADLNSMHAITVFAPANDAFAKLPSSAMTTMHSHTELAKILKYHVVNGSITPAALASGKPLTTLEGGTLKPSKMGAVYEVNNADVICGNIHTANATVYIINKVLIPMH